MEIALFLILSALYLAFAKRLGQRSITMPIVFLTLGLALGFIDLRVFEVEPQAEFVQLLAELTLVLILFADASMLDLRLVLRDAQLPGRLLGIGLPLTIALGALVARLLYPDQPLGMVLLVAAVLAPTDAALGLPVFTDKRIPVRIRNALNVESGLNDGIASPFVHLFLLLTLTEEGLMVGDWLRESVLELAIGVLVGLALGWLGGRVLHLAVERRWATGSSERLSILALALASYFLAVALGGNGFVASFVGGIVFGSVSRQRLAEETEFTEDLGTLLSLGVWSLFGATVAFGSLRDTLVSFDWRPILYAILSLTVVRMAPVAVSLLRTGLRPDTVALMGWFGPRGLASIVFGLLAVLEFEAAGQPAQPLGELVTWTVLLSVFAHGLTAQPLVRRYAARLEAAEAADMELVECPELAPRRRMLAHEME